MATVNEVILRVDRLRPNALEEEDKARWLMELDGRIYLEVTSADNPEARPPESWPEDGDMELLVPAPYAGLYELYLMAKVEFALQDYEGCENTTQLYNQAMSEFRAQYRRSHVPREVRLIGIF